MPAPLHSALLLVLAGAPPLAARDPGAFVGTVSDARGRPVADADVWLAEHLDVADLAEPALRGGCAPRILLATRTDERGAFRVSLDVLPAERRWFDLVALAPGAPLAIDVVHVEDLRRAATLRVTVPEPLDERVHLARDGFGDGVLLRPLAVHGAGRVHLLPRPVTERAALRIDGTDATWNAVPLARLVAYEIERGTRRSTLCAARGAPSPLVLHAGLLADAFESPRPGEARSPEPTSTLLVRDAERGDPVPAVLVRMRGSSGRVRFVEADARGRVSWPGADELRDARAVDGPLPWALAGAMRRTSNGQTILELRRGDAVTGRVVDGEGRALGERRLLVTPAGRPPFAVRTRTDGGFEIAGLERGSSVELRVFDLPWSSPPWVARAGDPPVAPLVAAVSPHTLSTQILARDGGPVRHAWIRYEARASGEPGGGDVLVWPTGCFVPMNRRGRADSPPGVPSDLEVRAVLRSNDGYAAASRWTARTDAPRTDLPPFAIERRVSWRGRVLDAEGGLPAGLGLRTDRFATPAELDPSGEYALRLVRRAHGFLLALLDDRVVGGVFLIPGTATDLDLRDADLAAPSAENDESWSAWRTRCRTLAPSPGPEEARIPWHGIHTSADGAPHGVEDPQPSTAEDARWFSLWLAATDLDPAQPHALLERAPPGVLREALRIAFVRRLAPIDPAAAERLAAEASDLRHELLARATLVGAAPARVAPAALARALRRAEQDPRRLAAAGSWTAAALLDAAERAGLPLRRSHAWLVAGLVPPLPDAPVEDSPHAVERLLLALALPERCAELRRALVLGLLAERGDGRGSALDPALAAIAHAIADPVAALDALAALEPGDPRRPPAADALRTWFDRSPQERRVWLWERFLLPSLAE